MNECIETLLGRRSIRAFEDRPVEPEVKEALLRATLRAPTAGNLMLYTIIEVSDQHLKDTLAVTCDNQPFIAKSPLVWLLLADYQRWYDYFNASGIPEVCRENGTSMRKPGEGDLFIACCDALIAAQNAVIAAEALGLGSCYIGDIMENWETHRDLFSLPRYVFPITMLCFGYPTGQQKTRRLTPRFDSEFIVYENTYRRLGQEEFERMFDPAIHPVPEGYSSVADLIYRRKFSADYTIELNRSVRAILEHWKS